MPVLTLVRGLPGSGKMKFAKYLAGSTGAMVICEDDFFCAPDSDKRYHSTPEMATQARYWCIEEVEHALKKGVDVIVHNVAPLQIDSDRYLVAAADVVAESRLTLRVHFVDLYDGGGLSHQELSSRTELRHKVSAEDIQKMRFRWQH